MSGNWEAHNLSPASSPTRSVRANAAARRSLAALSPQRSPGQGFVCGLRSYLPWSSEDSSGAAEHAADIGTHVWPETKMLGAIQLPGHSRWKKVMVLLPLVDWLCIVVDQSMAVEV